MLWCPLRPMVVSHSSCLNFQSVFFRHKIKLSVSYFKVMSRVMWSSTTKSMSWSFSPIVLCQLFSCRRHTTTDTCCRVFPFVTIRDKDKWFLFLQRFVFLWDSLFPWLTAVPGMDFDVRPQGEFWLQFWNDFISCKTFMFFYISTIFVSKCILAKSISLN